ncbi:MAG: aldo/keto reductase [Planctomycetes bacterium]|nr:aldo/keto reductase [Planctomycetota bacterium]
MERRAFLRIVGGAVGGCAFGAGAALGADGADPKARGSDPSPLPRRVLGRTGAQVSIIGFPGLSLIHVDQQRATEAIHAAFDAGVNHFDVAPAYGNGDAETKMGIGLRGIDRGKIFLSCKTKMRDAKGAREELERSLERLKTDRFDLYQLHALFTEEDVKKALGPGGAIETFAKAKDEGKARFFGFSAHTTRAALAAMKGFRFDTVMFPINFIEHFGMGFGKAVLALAREQGAAALAIKPMCRGAWKTGEKRTRQWWYHPVEDPREIALALRFTLSQEPVKVGFPPAFIDLLEKAIQAGRSYRPITEAEAKELETLAASCESVFKKDEQQVACGGAPRVPLHPGSPHECCPGVFA